MVDPIADMLTRIRNAQAARLSETSMRFSAVKQAIADILVREGFLERAVKTVEGEKALLTVTLKYKRLSPTEREGAIREIDRVSHQGCRIYVKRNDIEKVKNKYGVAILSTSQGIMTGTEAYRKGLGGEYLCKVW